MQELPTDPIPGIVYLVGAGPGDPGLLTLRGAELLRRADVVLYDYLVNPVIARHASKAAELVCLGRHGKSRIWTQEEINQRMLELTRAGKTVVRLKSGDPAIFARAAEESDFLRQHQVPFETVPGITAAMAAGSYAGVDLTDRDHASAVAFVTGRESAVKTEPLDYAALAKFPGTIVIYMGVTTVEQWSQQLIEHGMAGQTPVALIRRCSHADQQTQYCQLQTVTEFLTPYSKFPPPVLVIIGDVARDSGCETWFERRPLFAQRVLVTRSADQATPLCRQLEEAGAEVLLQPAIKIEAVKPSRPAADCLSRLHEFGWLTFSSANGVDYFFDLLNKLGQDARALGPCRVAAVGPSTRQALRQRNIVVDLMPPTFDAEHLARLLIPQLNNSACLVIRGTRSRGVLEQAFTTSGVDWQSLVVYASTDILTPRAEVAVAMQAGQIGWTLVTSPAIARAVVAQFGSHLPQTKFVSISPITSQALREAGCEVAIESTQATTSAMVAALVDHVSAGK
jgi:uroporphyrinogen III methyltransferase/synthase